jgi:GWxTD domain-containing protein
MFLDLPPSERDEFQEEFWSRRDPDPYTEENEFKLQYFGRMDRADELFHGEGRPGWLTDRGRIFILFGPPTSRITQPQGINTCQELWYYGNFPVVFTDRNCTGRYELVTYNLSSLRTLNLEYSHELGKAQAMAQQTIRDQSEFFDFDWQIRTSLVQEDKVEGLVSIQIPYKNIWFRLENEKMVTIMDIQLELLDANDTLVWEHRDTVKLEIEETTLEQDKGKKHRIEIPFIIDQGVDRLHKGANKFFLLLINQTGDVRLKKFREFKLQE